MKKLFLTLTLTFLFSAFCLFAQEEPVEQIEYRSLSRGYREIIQISRDSIFVEKGNLYSSTMPEKVGRATGSEEWEELMDALSGLRPEELPELQAPSKAHTFDGARHSTITVTTGSETYQTPVFDNYRAHARLQQLMDTIRKMEEEQGKTD